MNRHHFQVIGRSILLWGDTLIVHTQMSLSKVNYKVAKWLGAVRSCKRDPADYGQKLESDMENFIFR